MVVRDGVAGVSGGVSTAGPPSPDASVSSKSGSLVVVGVLAGCAGLFAHFVRDYAVNGREDQCRAVTCATR